MDERRSASFPLARRRNGKQRRPICGMLDIRFQYCARLPDSLLDSPAALDDPDRTTCCERERSSMNFTETTLQCPDCGTSFAFRAVKQDLFAGKSSAGGPKRCPLCAAARRIQSGDTGSNSMGYQGASRQMFSATCASCHRDTKVPFEPRSGRPIYCSSCHPAHGRR
jgi:CxxC-x17-CxxC domain-containing protein